MSASCRPYISKAGKTFLFFETDKRESIQDNKIRKAGGLL